MRFLLTRYEKDADFPDWFTDVTGVGSDAFADLLEVPVEQLVDAYPLKREHAERIRQLTGIALDLESYAYYLELEAY